MSASTRDLASYMTLPYQVLIIPDEDGDGYHATIRELKGCMAYGKTVEEAYKALETVKQVWLETALTRGWRIPQPVAVERTYSGEFRVRLPKFLHGDLVRMAEAEGTSLNQLVVALLSEGAERLRLDRAARTSPTPGCQELKVATAAAVAESQASYKTENDKS